MSHLTSLAGQTMGIVRAPALLNVAPAVAAGECVSATVPDERVARRVAGERVGAGATRDVLDAARSGRDVVALTGLAVVGVAVQRHADGVRAPGVVDLVDPAATRDR